MYIIRTEPTEEVLLLFALSKPKNKQRNGKKTNPKRGY